MNRMFKLLVKEAVLEALNEFVNGGISTLSEGDDSGTGNQNQSGIEAGGKEEGGEDESGKGGGSGATAGGGTGPGGKPKPDVGVGVFGLR